MKRILFENSKKFNKSKNIYFADWCLKDPKKISEKNILNLNKNIISSYHWNKEKKLERDYEYLKKVQKKILKILVKRLNNYHNTNFKEKYWKIIILPWLINILNMTFDKWEMVKEVDVKKHRAELYDYSDTDLIFEDYKDIGWFSKSTNLWIITKIFEFRSNLKFNKKIKLRKEKTEYVQFNLNAPSILKKKILIFLFRLFSFFFKNKIIIFNIGYKKIKNFIFHLQIRQFPFYWLIGDYKKNKVNLQKRKFFFKMKNLKKLKNFEEFFLKNLYLFIPKSYLEDYSSIKKSISESYWPKNCKKILTAYDYKINEQFKIWTAEMTNKGTKYIILQHGGGYGLEKFSIEEDMQKEMADVFLTWGWREKQKSVKNFYSILLNNEKIHVKKKNNKKVLIPLHHHGKYSFSVSSMSKTNSDRLKKINDMVSFTNSLKKNIQENTTIRYLKKLDKLFLLKFNKSYFQKNLNFDSGNKDFLEQLKKSKLVIHDLNSTTFLQSMFYNIPTILLIRKDIETMRTKYKSIIRDLERNNIVFYDPFKASKFVNNNYNEIYKWWNRKKVQNLRQKFCDIFAKEKSNLMNELKLFVR